MIQYEIDGVPVTVQPSGEYVIGWTVASARNILYGYVRDARALTAGNQSPLESADPASKPFEAFDALSCLLGAKHSLIDAVTAVVREALRVHRAASNGKCDI